MMAVRQVPEELATQLSPREISVLAHVLDGKSGKGTAYALGISMAQVSLSLANAALKLGLDGRRELVRRAAVLAADSSAVLPADVTRSEREILELIALGCTNAQIASLRGRSRATVSNQIAALLRKTGAANRRALVALYPPVCGVEAREQSSDRRL
jgi:DNA-binding CsgD family transcriptional regulator